MRILLLGDYSGFFVNLKDGLVELGHDVSLATAGDGFKRISNSDLPMPSPGKDVVGILGKLVFPFSSIKKYYHYDVVQIINHVVFPPIRGGYNFFLLKLIKKHSEKMFLSSCGTDYFVYEARSSLKYNAYDEEIGNCKQNTYTSKRYIHNNIKVLNLIDGIIATEFSYAVAYKEHAKFLGVIPLPINYKKIEVLPQTLHGGKVRIFHGLNRELQKGTRFIKEAILRLKENYPDDVEIIIDGKMPLNKYLSILRETNIVVDQCLSYGYGMNALYSMAMGKVVLSGNEPENSRTLGNKDAPIINIKPEVSDIYEKLEYLVKNKESIVELGRLSREYVEEYHDYKRIAASYLEVWGRDGIENTKKQKRF